MNEHVRAALRARVEYEQVSGHDDGVTEETDPRNEEIYRRALDGDALVDIARDVGLDFVTVRRIVRRLDPSFDLRRRVRPDGAGRRKRQFPWP